MEFLVERTIAILVAVAGPLLTIFDLPGNTLMLLTAFFFAFFDEAIYFNGRLLSAMVLIYAVGECWEFCVSLFGIKRKKVSWFAVLFIGAGGFIGTLLGTLIFPILGSLIGGMMGAFVTAFAYELLHTGLSKNAWELAWAAAKMRFMAIIGKLVAGIALAALLVKQVVFL